MMRFFGYWVFVSVLFLGIALASVIAYTTVEPVYAQSSEDLQNYLNQLGEGGQITPDLQKVLEDQLSRLKVPITVVVHPNIPEPYASATLEITRSGIDLMTGVVTWSVDGVVKKTGRAEKLFTLTVGGPGSLTRVNVSVRGTDGTSDSTLVTIRPSSIDLYSEATTYTPPFYRGRALQTIGGSLRVIAVPQIYSPSGFVSPSNIYFKWKHNGRIHQDASGYGRTSFALDGVLSSAEDIEVEASVPSQNILVRKRLTVEIRSPLVVLYETHPLLGTRYETALPATFALSGSESTITAVPYFFTAKTRNDRALKWSWRLNGELISNLTSSEVTLGAPESSSGGTSDIFVTAVRDGHELQRSSARSLIMYGANTSARPASESGREFLR